MSNASAAITAENTFATPIRVLGTGVDKSSGDFNVSVWGTFVATITLQRSFDNGVTWLDVSTYTVPTEDLGTEPEGAIYRIGVKTGGFTSGTANVRIGC